MVNAVTTTSSSIRLSNKDPASQTVFQLDQINTSENKSSVMTSLDDDGEKYEDNMLETKRTELNETTVTEEHDIPPPTTTTEDMTLTCTKENYKIEYTS
jgi:hypothetical protein